MNVAPHALWEHKDLLTSLTQSLLLEACFRLNCPSVPAPKRLPLAGGLTGGTATRAWHGASRVEARGPTGRRHEPAAGARRPHERGNFECSYDSLVPYMKTRCRKEVKKAERAKKKEERRAAAKQEERERLEKASWPQFFAMGLSIRLSRPSRPTRRPLTRHCGSKKRLPSRPSASRRKAAMANRTEPAAWAFLGRDSAAQTRCHGSWRKSARLTEKMLRTAVPAPQLGAHERACRTLKTLPFRTELQQDVLGCCDMPLHARSRKEEA